jgi:hypothetical protein
MKSTYVAKPMLPLHELQQSFFRSLATSPGASSGFEPILLDHVEGNTKLGPEERINIYAQMYFSRLVEVLSQNFPRVLTSSILNDSRTSSEPISPSTHPCIRPSKTLASILPILSQPMTLQ